MYVAIKKCQILRILIFMQVFMTDKIFCFKHVNEEKCHNPLRMEECVVLGEKLNLNLRSFVNYLKMITKAEQTFKNCRLLLNERNHTSQAITNNTLEQLDNFGKNKNLKINFTDFCEISNSIKLTTSNMTTVPSSIFCRNFTNWTGNIKQILRVFKKICRFSVKVCREKKQLKILQRPVCCTEGKWNVGLNATPWTNITNTTAVFSKSKEFNIINEEPEYINISLREGTKADEVFILHANFANNTAPRFECRKILGRNLIVYVMPDVNYLICLAVTDKYFQLNIFDCQPYKTKPLLENQPWLLKKSMPTLITSVFVLLILAMAMGASILYLSVLKNPPLIRGIKRTVKVKRQDKRQTSILPRDYESLPQDDNPQALSVLNDALEPAISSLSCDTNSTISYISAIQPTPVEILTYRLSRLRELFQNNNNNIPLSVSSLSFSMSLNQRLPPNVDLLLEYEWYTITTTVIMPATATTTIEKEE